MIAFTRFSIHLFLGCLLTYFCQALCASAHLEDRISKKSWLAYKTRELPRPDLHALCVSAHFKDRIPKIIWQTYKTRNLPRPALLCQETWTLKNPDYLYNFYDDDDMGSYIREKWNEDTYEFFEALPLGVMKADLWRYLILATEGGVYSDIDSICCIPIRNWTKGVQITTANVLLLGFDHDGNFCQWTIAATKEHPAMIYVCNYIVEKWKSHGKKIFISEHFVHATTGPDIWTDALLEYMGEKKDSNLCELFERYISDMQFQKKVNELGIYLVRQGFFSGIASKNLFGSQTFGEGYIQWTKERDRIREKN